MRSWTRRATEQTCTFVRSTLRCQRRSAPPDLSAATTTIPAQAPAEEPMAATGERPHNPLAVLMARREPFSRSKTCQKRCGGQCPPHKLQPRAVIDQPTAFARAWSRSAMMSSASSMPMDTRTTFGSAPAAARCSSDNCRCVVDAE